MESISNEIKDRPRLTGKCLVTQRHPDYTQNSSRTGVNSKTFKVSSKSYFRNPRLHNPFMAAYLLPNEDVCNKGVAKEY